MLSYDLCLNALVTTPISNTSKSLPLKLIIPKTFPFEDIMGVQGESIYGKMVIFKVMGPL